MKTLLMPIGLLLIIGLAQTADATGMEPQAKERPALIARIIATTEQVVPNPQWLDSPQWQSFVSALAQPEMVTLSDDEFRLAFNQGTANLPFSHYRLMRPDASASAENTTEPLRLTESDHDTAILSIDHMSMGAEVMAAMVDRLRRGDYRYLVLDLRTTPGGSFPAGITLGHFLTNEPVDTGVYLTRRWFMQHGDYPDAEAIAAIEPLEDLNLQAFHQELEQTGVLRILVPAHDGALFSGEKLFVLTSSQTASAAEPLVYLLAQRPDKVTIIGETTAGAMLSGERFDMGNGWVLFAPVADYMTPDGQRIDGKGVAPHVEVPAEQALDKALEMIRARQGLVRPIVSMPIRWHG